MGKITEIHNGVESQEQPNHVEDMKTQLSDHAEVCDEKTEPNHVEDMKTQLSDHAEVCDEQTEPNHVEKTESDVQNELKNGLNGHTEQNSDQSVLITDEVDEMNHEGDTTIEYLPGVSESLNREVKKENQSGPSDVSNIKKESVKQESGQEANHVEVKKEVKTELKEESVKTEVNEERVKKEVKQETKCGVSSGTDDEHDQEEDKVTYDVIRKVKKTHDSVLKLETLENKLVCRARHPLPPNQRVDDFLERTKLKKEQEDRELQQKEADKDNSTFIPTHADEELIDVSAMTSNAIAAIMAGKVH